MGYTLRDMRGERYGRLIVLSRAADYVSPKGAVQPKWLCRCDCGAEKAVTAGALRSGRTLSCGCLRDERSATTCFEHGLGETSEYKSWHGMISRCTNPAHHAWDSYGGRGITVCERWMKSVKAFVEDMGTRPSKAHTLDRIDNSRGYSPDNCRWADKRQQARNRRNSVYATFRGERMLVTEVAEAIGIPYSILIKRIYAGWPEARWPESPRARRS